MTAETKDLVPVHGGCKQLVDRVVPLSQRKRFLAEAAKLPSLRVTAADLSTVHRLADGALSPLEGPMRADVWHRVLEEKRIEANGGFYAWGIPLSLPVTDDEATALSAGGSVAVCQEDGEVVAIVDAVEIFDWDKDLCVPKVSDTEGSDHPGGRLIQDGERLRLGGGSCHALPEPPPPAKG